MFLGRTRPDIRNDLAVVRRAMEAGVWLHSSPTYNMGFTYMMLRTAFDANRAQNVFLFFPSTFYCLLLGFSGETALVGRGMLLPAPPTKPDVQISRIRLSG